MDSPPSCRRCCHLLIYERYLCRSRETDRRYSRERERWRSIAGDFRLFSDLSNDGVRFR